MSLHDQIEQDYLKAFKARDQAKVDVLRLVKAALKNTEIELRHQPLTDDEVVAVLTREAKRRQESASLYQQGQRPELAATEEAEYQTIKTYLPAQLSDDELIGTVKTVIAELNPTPKDFGRVMSAVMAKVKGQADGQRVSTIVKKLLTTPS